VSAAIAPPAGGGRVTDDLAEPAHALGFAACRARALRQRSAMRKALVLGPMPQETASDPGREDLVHVRSAVLAPERSNSGTMLRLKRLRDQAVNR
jgi:hypothetical protein